jgi:hypothetical protein
MMMQNRWMIIIILVIGLVISACSSQAKVLPTVVAFPTDIPPTESLPTVTPEVTVTLTATSAELSTLPPTWTFTPDVTETPIVAEESLDTPTPLPTPSKIELACESFQADSERSIKKFIIGESPVAAWTSVEGAVLYHVFLYDFDSKTINDQIYTDETFWTFNPDHFELGQNYIWAVWPLDSIGDQMCYERGLELLPQPVPVGG